MDDQQHEQGGVGTSDGGEGRSWAELRDERRRALSQLAAAVAAGEEHRSTPPTSSARRVRGWRRWKRWQVVVGALLVLATVAGIVVHTVATPSRPSVKRLPSLLHFVPGADGLDCPMDAQWSPDGKYVAILGYYHKCNVMFNGAIGDVVTPLDEPTSDPPSGLVCVYDTRTGALVLQVKLDRIVSPAVKVPAATAAFLQSATLAGQDTPTLSFAYTHLLWLSGGRRLAVTFRTFEPSGPAPASSPWEPGTYLDGVVVINRDVAPPVVLTQDAGSSPASHMVEWNLEAGKTVAPSRAITSDTPYSSLPPALSYAWDDQGNPTDAGQVNWNAPLGAASASAPASAQVGNPDGGDSFTLWQQGDLAAYVSPDASARALPPAYFWTTDFAAVSPDSRFLLSRVTYTGQIEVNGKPAGQSEQQWYHLNRFTVLPVHDAGLARVLSNLTDQVTSKDNTASVHVAWRLDGKYLAAQTDTVNGGAHPELHGVSIYDCRTGKLLTTLAPRNQEGSPSSLNNDLNQLRWSPDGTRLFLFDMQLGEVTIWGPGALPS